MAPDDAGIDRPAVDPSRRAATIARERDGLRALLESIGGAVELPPLLQRVLAHACALVGASRGAVVLRAEHGGELQIAAASADDAPDAPALPDLGLAGRVLHTGAPVLRRSGAGHVLGVPIARGDERLGVLLLARDAAAAGGRRGAFGRRDVAALETLARDTAVAVVIARRFASERQRAERLALIAHVGRLVAADLHLDELLQRAADAIHELLGYDNVAVALVAPEAPEVLSLRHFGGAYKVQIGGAHRIRFGEGLMGAAARTRSVVLTNDAASDPRYLPTPGAVGTHAELVVPLLLAGGLLGVLNVERRAPFGAEDVDHLRVVADQLAVAIENARLHEAARRAAVLEERQRLARELHDSVSQQLFTAAMVAQGLDAAYARDRAEGARRAGMLVGLTRGALAEMRSLLAELRPAAAGGSAEPPPPDAGFARLREEGLVGALRAHIATHLAPELVGALRVTLEAAGYAPQPSASEEALYRIAREALHNVVKHAGARHAAVRLACTRTAVRLTVRDDGCGFTAADVERRRGHTGGLGLSSMRERVAQLGGTLQVASDPRAGTRLAAALPLAPAPAPEHRP